MAVPYLCHEWTGLRPCLWSQTPLLTLPPPQIPTEEWWRREGGAGREENAALLDVEHMSDCKNQEIYSLEKKKKDLPSQALCEVVGKKERRYQEELVSSGSLREHKNSSLLMLG